MYTYTAQLVRVIDGDTVVLNIDLGFKTYRMNESYRLAGINAPELSTPTGVLAKTHLEGLISGPKKLVVHTTKADKYGRYLVNIEIPGGMVSDRMITDGFAVKY